MELDISFDEKVSTHSRAKAAAVLWIPRRQLKQGFNTQPREGGCVEQIHFVGKLIKFQHTAARRRLRYP